MNARGVAGAVLWVALAGCRPAAGPGADVSAVGDDATQTPRRGHVRPRAGAAHSGNIDRVRLSPDGTMAITRDQIGGVRAWTRLDGTAEPVVIPTTGANAMSVAPRGEDGAATVAVVESSGGAKIFGIDAAGEVTARGELPPFAPLLWVEVLPGGDRILALFKDHTIRVVDAQAEELMRLQPRRFRATQLVVGPDGKSFVALAPQTGGLQAQRGTIANEIALAGEVTEVKMDTAFADSTTAVSSDGQRLVVVDKAVGNNWELVAVDLAKGGAVRRLSVPLPAHVRPWIGFADERQLLVTANDGTLSWAIDIDEGTRRPRPPVPQDFINEGRAQSVRKGTHVAAHGTWLYVHDTATQRQRYLGYRATQAQSIALSPDGTHVAWAFSPSPLVIGSVDGRGEEIDVDPGPDGAAFGTVRVEFVDPDTLVTIDGAGGLRLVRWRTSEVVDHVGVVGGVRSVQYDPDTRLLLVDRHTNDARVFRVTDAGFEGPWLVADGGFRMGLLRHGAPGHATAVLWTLDSSNRTRHYTLEQLQADLSQAEIDAIAKPLKTGEIAPLAVGRDGRGYGVRWNGTAMEMFVSDGADTKTVASPAGDVSQIVVAPDGSRLVAVHQRGQSTTLTAHHGTTLDEQWSYDLGAAANEIEWSADGKRLALAAVTGAAILDGATGQTVHRRCGADFVSAGSPPPSALSAMNLRSLCE